MSGRRPRNVVVGMMRLARFRADGLGEFEGTRRALLDSFAPLLALTLVGATLMALNGAALDAASNLLSTSIVLFAPPVLSEPLARWWGRDAQWGRYCVAFNWCQWIVPLAFVASLFVAQLLATVGSSVFAAYASMAGVVAYALTLHWFVASRGLSVSGLRAALLVLVVNLGTGLLAFGPRLLLHGGLGA